MSSANFTWLYLVSCYLFPAFSISTFMNLPPAQNYAILTPLFIFVAHRQIRASNISTLCLLLLNFSYILIAVSLRTSQSVILLGAYFLFAGNILLIYNLSRQANYKKIVYKFFKIFFYINFLYIIYQNTAMNSGLGDLVMLHSNDPLQINSSYKPTVYIAPFYRVTGLFNESSPFTFYLIIYSWFLYVIKTNDKITQFLVICSILIGGAKIGLIYIACLFVVKIFGKLSVYILGAMASFFVYALFNFRDALQVIFMGRAGSIFLRFDESIETIMTTTNISLISFNFTAKSAGSLGLDIVSIVLSNFGILYLCFLICILLIVALRLKVCIEHKLLFLSVLGLGLVSSGSLLIPQYSIIFISIFYINSQNQVTSSQNDNKKIVHNHTNL